LIKNRIHNPSADIKRGVNQADGFADVGLVKNRSGGIAVETGKKRIHYLTKGQGGLDEPSVDLRTDETKLHGLTAKADGCREKWRRHGLLADIQKSVLDAGGQAGKNHALESPIGDIHQLLAPGAWWGSR
jgi:hypothetical protein